MLQKLDDYSWKNVIFFENIIWGFVALYKIISPSFQHLGTLLIVQQVIGQVREALIPYLMYKNRKRHIKARSDSVNQSDAGIEPLLAEHNAQVAHGVKVSSDSQLQARIESSKDEYDVSNSRFTTF